MTNEIKNTREGNPIRLVGDFGEAVLDEFEGRVERDFPSEALHLKTFSLLDGEVVGGTPFAVTLLNDLKIVRENRLRIAQPSDLHRFQKTGVLNLDLSQQVYCGLLLEKDNGDRDSLEKNLHAEIKNKPKGYRFPVLIPLSNLWVISDPWGSNHYKYMTISFRPCASRDVIDVPQLQDGGCFLPRRVDETTGLPKRLIGQELFSQYTRDDFLSQRIFYKESTPYGPRVVAFTGAGEYAAYSLRSKMDELTSQTVSRNRVVLVGSDLKGGKSKNEK